MSLLRYANQERSAISKASRKDRLKAASAAAQASKKLDEEIQAQFAALPITLEGAWTPVLTGLANVDSTTAFPCSYLRVGFSGICWGVLAVDPTAGANTATSVSISLPFLTNLATGRELAGTAAAASAHRSARIIGDATNDVAVLAFASESTASITFTFMFACQILV